MLNSSSCRPSTALQRHRNIAESARQATPIKLSLLWLSRIRHSYRAATPRDMAAVVALVTLCSTTQTAHCPLPILPPSLIPEATSTTSHSLWNVKESGDKMINRAKSRRRARCAKSYPWPRRPLPRSVSWPLRISSVWGPPPCSPRLRRQGLAGWL